MRCPRATRPGPRFRARALLVASWGLAASSRCRSRSLIGLTPLLFRVRGYARPVGAGPIRRPALTCREVCWLRTHTPSSSPAARPAARAGRPSPRPLRPRALVSFTRGHAHEGGTGEHRAPAFRDCGSLGRNRERRACRRGCRVKVCPGRLMEAWDAPELACLRSRSGDVVAAVAAGLGTRGSLGVDDPGVPSMRWI